MAQQFITSDEKDLSYGIDAYSAENQISKGFLKDLLNGDVLEKRVSKRKGYQGFGGSLPIRVASLISSNTDNTIQLTLQSGINLLSVRSSPLVIYGKTSSGDTGVFSTTDSGHYYSGFTSGGRKTLVATAGSPDETISILEAEHSLGTPFAFVGISEALDSTSQSNEQIAVSNIAIDSATNEIVLSYQNSTGANKDAYVYYLPKSGVAGESYVATGTGATASIPAATHVLENLNIIVQCYQDDGSNYNQVVPDSLTVSSTGDVDVVFSSSIDYVIVLSVSAAANLLTGGVSGNSSGTLVLSNPDSGFIFGGLYRSSGSDLEQVIPDSIIYDADTDEVTISLTNNSPDPQTFTYYYEYGEIRSNTITVSDSAVSADVTDTSPQLTVWGLDHSEIYGTSKQSREGWVNHIDSYRREAEQRIVAGLGGNLFTARARTELAAAYKLPELTPSLTYTVSGDQVLGPLFWETGSTPARTRGYILGDDSGTNWATVTAVSYDSGNGWTKYTISVPNKQILDASGSVTTLASVISTTAGKEDYLTAQDMSFGRHNGTFLIKQILDDTDSIHIWVENDDNTEDYDDSGVAGQAGIFTDQILFSAVVDYLPGDTLNSSAFDSDTLIEVKSALGQVAVVSLIDRSVGVGNGLRIPATRTSNVIPMTAVTNLVRGDMLSYTGVDRLVRVLHINAQVNRTVAITGDGETAVVTLSAGSTSGLSIGMCVALSRAGEYSGVQTITEIDGDTMFHFASTVEGTAVAGVLVGNTAHIDEQLEFEDSIGSVNVFEVGTRFIPAEAPEDTYDLTPSTYVRHFDTSSSDEQAFLRSVMAQNNMYLTNGEDEVMKYDGENIYRAGLFPWQPGCFLTKDVTSASKIVMSWRSFSYTSNSPGKGQLTITSAETATIPVGASVRLTGSTKLYTVMEYNDDGTNYYVVLDRALDSSVATAGTCSEVGIRKYYFRLNAVDVNNNVTASAVAQSQDFAVELTSDAAVRIRLVGMPAWHIYDYDRLEVEIYATKTTSQAPFYKITTLQMNFDSAGGYLDFVDSFADEDLVDLDPVNSALLGAELGTRWNEPLRAKYLTSAGNRLILGNVRDYPQLDIQYVADGTSAVSTFDGDTILFRKDNTDTSTTTNMVDRVRYEFRNTSAAVSVTGITGTAGASFSVAAAGHGYTTAGQWVYLYYSCIADSATWSSADVDIGTETITSANHGLTNGTAVTLTTAGTLPTGLSAGTTYYVVGATTNTFQLSTTSGGSAENLTGAGAGISTVNISRPLNYAGWWQVASVTDVNNFVVNHSGATAGAATSFPDKFVFAASGRVDVPVLLTATDGNLGMANGNSAFVVFQTMRRMAAAINATMRKVDTTISGQGTFSPWMQARGGNDIAPAGRLIVRQPLSLSTTIEVKFSAFTGYQVFVNDVRRSASAEVSASTRVYPSRLLISYENFPEIFDAPTSASDFSSASAIDVNPADGQEITGVIPFFGDAAFTSAQQAAILVVFKTNSVYLVDMNEKAAGRNPVQRIETEGLGCTAPYSIAPTRGGIAFANESGIYCLRRNQSIEFLGKFMSRNWSRTDRSALEIVQGHHYALGRKYKLSVPLLDAANTSDYIENSEVFVYDHTNEVEGKPGAWSRYDNHAATGWANLNEDAYFCSTDGRVFSIRRIGDDTDYRDDASPVDFVVVTRANDFGDSGIRKILDKIMVNYRVGSTNLGTTLEASTDLRQEFRSTQTFRIVIPTVDDALGDVIPQDIVTIAHSTDRSKGIYFQVRISNSTLDEPLEIAGLDYVVGGLNARGTTQAAETTR